MIKERKDFRVTIRLPEDLYNALKKLSDHYGLTVSDYIRRILDRNITI